MEKEWQTHLEDTNNEEEIFEDVDECILKVRTSDFFFFFLLPFLEKFLFNMKLFEN